LLEIGIIITLALIFFFVLKNFPKTGESQPERMKKESFWEKAFSKKKESLAESIQEEIEKNQEKIIAPVEINLTSEKYEEADPEIAKLLYEADTAFEKNDLRAAEDLAIEAISKEKKCGQAYVIVGKIAFTRGVLQDAKAAFKAAMKCNDELGEAYFGMGSINLREENFTKAIENLSEAVSIDRGKAEWYAELGKAYMEVRQFAKAAKALKRAASLDIDNKEYKELASEAEDKQRAHATVFGR
jgi:tetratricopeptide (TPR) repeat protein